MPRDAFPGYDDPVNIDMEPEDAVELLVADEDPEGDDTQEPPESADGDSAG